MTKTANRRRKVIMPVSIKKKLGAAICMLLIAAIMMISSTYAWFTLSTAPEVKGIQTNVGANGNLEIALLSGTALFSDQDDLGILSAIGDSMDVAGKDVTVANATWGNLVDLSTAYGLNTVTMLPSALNISEILDDSNQSTGEYTIKNSDSPLLAPLYGSDGRVISVLEPTLIGKYQDPSIYPLDNFSGRESGNGVGIIGTASGRNERMKNYPVALGNALNNINAARNNAQTMLQTNGSSIASIFIKIATADTSNLAATTFTKAEVETLGSMITGLETSNGYVWLAIKDIALASTLSRANDVELTDAQVTQLVADAEAASTPAELAAVTNMRAFTDEINDAIDNYEATATKISSARDAYNAFDVENNDGPFGYAAVKSLIDHLIDKTRVQVADKVNPGRDDKQDLIDAATGGQAVPITLLSGSGALYDIAKSAGDYRATGIETDVDNSGLTVHVRVSISTQAEAPILLTAARDQAVADLAPTNASGSTGSLDNAYGYVIDFGFRTNAPDAKLLLQDQARQRIYNDGTVTNTQTLGGGTYVKFSSLDLDKFTLDDIRALVSALRIVFAIPELGEDSETGNVTLSYKILTIAAPDIKVTKNENTGEKTYDGGTPSDEDGDGTEETLTVNIALFGFDIADASDGGKIVTLGTKKLDAEDNTKNDLTLLTLTQNVAQKLSTVIYFDGDAIDNTMVANAEKSMTGSLNFQFATDVDLVPMENASLRNGENAPSEAEQIAAAKTKLHTAIEYIEDCDTYDTISAKAEGDRTEAEAAFMQSLSGANAVYADDAATLDEVNSAGTDLASKFNAVATNEEKAELLQLMQ